MALLTPFPYYLTQDFGPSHLTVEPSMYANSVRAYWQPYPGLYYVQDMHAALDLAAAEGTAIKASEAGIVSYAGWRNNGGGYCVEVTIRPGVLYEHSHCSRVLVRLGQRVTRGQIIAQVGSTGTATGNHSHFTVSMRETVSGVVRTFLWDPALFLPGGSLANDWRIQPLQPPADYVVVNGVGINIRWRPDLSSDRFVWATSRADGIYRKTDTGWVRHCDLDQVLKFGGWVSNPYGDWARVYMAGGYRYCLKQLIHFT